MDAHPTAILVVVLVLLSWVGAVSFSYGNPNAIHCRAEEREALLEFKKDFSRNDFRKLKIPDFFGSLASLTYLNLSLIGFGGSIPPQIGNISSLHYLDLGHKSYVENYNDLYVSSDDVRWISHLISIEFLDMSYVDLNQASSNWLLVMSMLPSLSTLHLFNCLLGNTLPLSHVNFSSLSTLDLSSNLFDSSIFGCLYGLPSLLLLSLRDSYFLGGSICVSLQNMTTLQMLDLSYCELNFIVPEWLYGMTNLQSLNFLGNKFRGSISSAIDNLTSLTELHLYENDLEGRIPRSMGNLCSLRVLDLSWNQLNGDIFEFLGHNSCIQETLESLNLSGNHLSDQLFNQLAKFKTLSNLDISVNSISGPIPMSIRKLSSLRDLDTSSNFFNGSIPESLGSFSKLETLDISNNSLQGTISEVHLVEFLLSTQIQSFSPRSFIGNHDLCGPPLAYNYTKNDDHAVPIPNGGMEGEHDIWIDMKWFYMGLPFGFVREDGKVKKVRAVRVVLCACTSGSPKLLAAVYVVGVAKAGGSGWQQKLEDGSSLLFAAVRWLTARTTGLRVRIMIGCRERGRKVDA
ncbi:LRR receptor-like serine/threonine-protein kinase GSO1 [Malania oleifera]|uniref:LRR receptor-like serine/threonine-protein kinase GSO1 n=1 Tax=Malania oleifera TaxID=397392 RepID=UPI0025AE6028|nr:LRR receptor-like serine/threonine-protein kinase GSO1 [Malania oleifera]